MGPAILDPEVGINFATMVHGGQEFVWGAPVVAGDEITTTASVKDISERAGMGFYVFESVSRTSAASRLRGDLDQHRARGADAARASASIPSSGSRPTST